jgi:threonine dehydratase
MCLYMTFHFPFDPREIWRACSRIRGMVLRTPLVYSPSLSMLTGGQIYLKMECWQLTGSFKVRGAVNMVAALTQKARDRGLVTASSGNHGTGLAYASAQFGNPPTTVFLPETADPQKIEKIRSYGAEAVLYGENYTIALAKAQSYAETENATYVHSHSHPLIIGGQGTIGLEIMEDLPDTDVVIVPIGGGGLISGVSTAVKQASSDTVILGVEPSAAPGAYLSLRDGRCREDIEIKNSVADGLLGTLTPLTFDVCSRNVESVAVVEDDEVMDAMRVLQRKEQIMVEGSSAVGLAAILTGKVSVEDKKTVLVLTGRNIDAQKYNKIMTEVD